MARKEDAGLYASRPDFDENPLWLVEESTAADTDYTSEDCREFGTVWLEFIFKGADSDAGVLFIEWSMDDVTFYPFAFDADKFSVIDAGGDLVVDEAAGSITVSALPAEARFSLGVEKPPPFLRGRWDFTAGGTDGMSGKSFGRA